MHRGLGVPVCLTGAPLAWLWFCHCHRDANIPLEELGLDAAPCASLCSASWAQPLWLGFHPQNLGQSPELPQLGSIQGWAVGLGMEFALQCQQCHGLCPPWDKHFRLTGAGCG